MVASVDMRGRGGRDAGRVIGERVRGYLRDTAGGAGKGVLLTGVAVRRGWRRGTVRWAATG